MKFARQKFTQANITKKPIRYTFSVLLAVFLLNGCQPKTEETHMAQPVAQLSYPHTEKGDVVDTYFGQEVADPYRWLEDDRSEQTGNWVDSQNNVTQSYLNNISYREEIAQSLREIINYERVSAPFVEGNYTYFYKNDGLQNQSVVYRKKGDGEPEVFIDPNTLSEDGTVSLASLSFSSDGTLAAYMTSTGGSDWREVFIINAENMEPIGEKLINVKFSSIQWYKNEGVFYSSYDKPDGSELSEKTDQHKLYYHVLGTSQKDDTKIFGHTDAEKHRYVGAKVSDDSRYLLVSAAVSTSGNRAFLKDLSDDNSPWLTVKQSVDSDVYMLTNSGNTLYLVTNQDAPNTKVVKVDANNPDVSNWKDVIPQN